MKGRVVWITGGGSGIGRALALEYDRRGASVAVMGRRAEPVEATAAELSDGLAIQGDVTSDEDLERAVAAILDRWGKLDIAIANAGFGAAGRVEKLDRETWRRQLEVNVTSAAMTAHYAIPHLKQTQGRLALVGSVMAFLPMPKLAPYNASKAAVLALGRTLSAELKRDGVSCTTIQPGYVESDLARVDNEGHLDPEREDKRPKQLMWKAEDAARVMVDAIERRAVEYTFTGHGKLAVMLGRHLPGLVQLVLPRL